MSTTKRITSANAPRQKVPKTFLDKLGEMHRSETELALSLPLVARAAKSKDLKTLVRVHAKETRNHVKTLNTIAKSLDTTLPSRSCKPVTQLIKEAVKVMATRLVSPEIDAELIAVALKIEGFEIDAYTALCAEAKSLRYTHEFALLTSILNQEKLAKELLGQLGEGKGPLKPLIEKASLERAGAKNKETAVKRHLR